MFQEEAAKAWKGIAEPGIYLLSRGESYAAHTRNTHILQSITSTIPNYSPRPKRRNEAQRQEQVKGPITLLVELRQQ